MSLRALLLRYAFAIALREWIRCPLVRPKIRVGVTATIGALIAPWVVFVRPSARLYWLITGKQLIRRPSFVMAQPYAFVNLFPAERPAEIRELLERLEHQRAPGSSDGPWWLDAWCRFAEALYWTRPRGLGEASARPSR